MKWLGGKTGGASGMMVESEEERKSDTKKCTHRETDIDKHMQKEAAVSLGILGCFTVSRAI